MQEEHFQKSRVCPVQPVLGPAFRLGNPDGFAFPERTGNVAGGLHQGSINLLSALFGAPDDERLVEPHQVRCKLPLNQIVTRGNAHSRKAGQIQGIVNQHGVTSYVPVIADKEVRGGRVQTFMPGEIKLSGTFSYQPARIEGHQLLKIVYGVHSLNQGPQTAANQRAGQPGPDSCKTGQVKSGNYLQKITIFHQLGQNPGHFPVLIGTNVVKLAHGSAL